METQSIRDRCFNLYIRHDEILRQKKNIEVIIEGLEGEVKKIASDKQELDEVWETLRDLLDKFSAESICMLKELLNKGLKSIFQDRDYEINVSISDTKNKKLKLLLVEHTETGMVEVELGSGTLLMNGGGVLVVVSFIFQVFLIVMYGKRKFMCIDEGFTNISSTYVEGFFKFLKYLHTEMGFTFLMVNHDQRFMPYFDKVYDVSMGKITAK
jgi:DNA repair exonuclease SbcCD ATPase subunit